MPSRLLLSLRVVTRALIFMIASASAVSDLVTASKIQQDATPFLGRARARDGGLDLLNTREKKVQRVGDTFVGEAIKSGAFGAKKGESLPAISPDGKPVFISTDDAYEALNGGYVYETRAAEIARAEREIERASSLRGEAGLTALAGIGALLLLEAALAWLRWLVKGPEQTK
jgi:hypothetical protein